MDGVNGRYVTKVQSVLQSSQEERENRRYRVETHGSAMINWIVPTWNDALRAQSRNDKVWNYGAHLVIDTSS